jgi:Ca2+-transporting ATPase
LLTLVLYVPSFRGVLEFSTLHPNDIAVCLGLAAISVAWFQFVKWLSAEKTADAHQGVTR